MLVFGLLDERENGKKEKEKKKEREKREKEEEKNTTLINLLCFHQFNYTANEKPRHIVGIFKMTRICRQYVAKWLIQHQTLASSIEVILK